MSSTSFKQFMRLVVIPLIVVIAAADLAILMGWRTTGLVIGYVGLPLVMMVSGAYLVFFDSKKRWPELNAWQRWTKIMTFQS